MENIFLNPEEFEKIFSSHLKIETYSKSIDSLFSERLLNKIDYAPYYQRNYVWDAQKASYFIESILLGTEIPPLIFFNNGDSNMASNSLQIEVIDGRQRFETIKRFREDDLALNKKGLLALKLLSKSTYSNLAAEQPKIRNLFDDAKIRIIEFKIISKNEFEPRLVDKIKKEIFARYNSGITPLKKSEIDNAKYDDDNLSNHFKLKLKLDNHANELISSLFFQINEDKTKKIPLETILNFIRKNFALTIFPIKYYARGTDRTELIEKAYEFYANKIDDPDLIYKIFTEKLKLVNQFKSTFVKNNLNHNWLVFECLLWALLVLEKEDFDLENLRGNIIQEKFAKYISENIESYNDKEYHYYKETMERYQRTGEFFMNNFNVNFPLYIWGDSDSISKVKELKKHNDTETKLSELETLRITKPEPSRNSIDDISRMMGKKRFIVRPSYQRAEVINYKKASAIIESIILGVPLPAIFVYKKENGTSEVIDGQQRLLTILGFIGSEYMDESGKTVRSKKHEFKLKDLRILEDFKGNTFNDLPSNLKDKILDFELFIVEIEEKLNPEFNPVDLFIRLNDKPYPIKEHSFEMWNSWADFEIINLIKQKVENIRPWFHIRKFDERTKNRDRMQNEELFTSLVYLDYVMRNGG